MLVRPDEQSVHRYARPKANIEAVKEDDKPKLFEAKKTVEERLGLRSALRGRNGTRSLYLPCFRVPRKWSRGLGGGPGTSTIRIPQSVSTSQKVLLVSTDLRMSPEPRDFAAAMASAEAEKANYAGMHFDNDLNFGSMKNDMITGTDVVRMMTILKPTRDLKSRLLSATKGLGDVEMK
ncbi:U4/U6 small nuclear ribonucleoprotein prp4 [Coniosporium apollinis]|uniref:U4/U6 small nuclear ribonucleoprotein prp4 n=1 Tax=Coniosporium apollinis TaxID=61459 RepID=A0ABQ9NQN7_9PEZI|nr:U4/U6 small nuclear ribonucleoprotein prp4 [Coniosporium apollinis]